MSHKDKGSEKFVRKVVKNGRGSYYINIPAELVREMRKALLFVSNRYALGQTRSIRERQKLVITRRGKKLMIEDWE